MEEDIKKHSGSKYVRRIYSCTDPKESIEVDVYSVLEAFGDPPEPIAHAIKKLLCCSIRGKGDAVQDLKEARDAVTRAIQRAEREHRRASTVLTVKDDERMHIDHHFWATQSQLVTEAGVVGVQEVTFCLNCKMLRTEWEKKGRPSACIPSPPGTPPAPKS